MMPVRPLCFDGVEFELAASIVEMHDTAVSCRGFAPELSEEQLDEVLGRVASVVNAAFCTVFGSHPTDRYRDVFEQISLFASMLAKDHIFPDENKRTTVTASLSILELAGVTLDIEDADDPDGNELYMWVQDVVTGSRDIDVLSDVLRERSIPLPAR